MDAPNVFMAVPTYDGCMSVATAHAVYIFASRGIVNFVLPGGVDDKPGDSLLAKGFNTLWCQALNSGNVDYFAMVHADVVPEHYWLDTLIEEMHAHQLELISATIPIKDYRGITSTALETKNPWGPRRLTLHEIHNEFPETITQRDQAGLLVNTGCWVCKFNPRWREELCFTIQDDIVKDPKGQFHPVVRPEDWNFSRQLRLLNVPFGATRKVKIRHLGTGAFDNDKVWGEWKTDQAHATKMGDVTKPGVM